MVKVMLADEIIAGWEKLYNFDDFIALKNCHATMDGATQRRVTLTKHHGNMITRLEESYFSNPSGSVYRELCKGLLGYGLIHLSNLKNSGTKAVSSILSYVHKNIYNKKLEEIIKRVSKIHGCKKDVELIINTYGDERIINYYNVHFATNLKVESQSGCVKTNKLTKILSDFEDKDFTTKYFHQKPEKNNMDIRFYVPNEWSTLISPLSSCFKCPQSDIIRGSIIFGMKILYEKSKELSMIPTDRNISLICRELQNLYVENYR